MSALANKSLKKKLFVKSWGCQMNVYDSHRMADILAPLGYESSDTPEGADMMILNTCHIREKATDKVFSELGRMRPYKVQKEEQGEKMLIAVAGCVAQAEGDFILERAPYVDMVFGPQTYHELPEMVAKATGERVVNTELTTENKFDKLPEEQRSQGSAAFVSIQEGCDKFCTYCVVPYTRGAEYSRKAEDVLEECQRLADTGAQEITLLGQNVNAFHGTGKDGSTWGLARLIRAVSEIKGVERIRYTTSHPGDMEDDLIAAHGEIEKLMPFLHLPVQSGSNEVLKGMNRKHTAEHYLDVLAQLRKARPDMAFSSDFIVAFPGEKDEDFEQTMEVVRQAQYASAYSFKFSARPGTPAAKMAGLVRPEVADERLARLQALINEQQAAFNKKCEGLTLGVLFDRKGKKPGQIQGRSPYNQSVHVQAPERLLGHIIDVKITNGFENSLSGELVLHDDVMRAQA